MYKHHENGKTNIMRLQGKLRVQTSYSDGTEKIEEWCTTKSKSSPSTLGMASDKENQKRVLLLRKWKPNNITGIQNTFGSRANNVWEYEVGDDTSSRSSLSIVQIQDDDPRSASSFQCQMLMNPLSPSWHVEMTDKLFVYKLKQCPWPESNFIVDIDNDTQEIILRTQNKKYYKRFQIPALVRMKEHLDKNSISLSHDGNNNQLKITYKKPEKLMEVEKVERQEMEKRIHRLGNDGEIDCNPS